MKDALTVFWQTLLDWWNSMVGLAVFNLIWLGLSLTVVLLPAATLGMQVVTNSIAHGRGQHPDDFFHAMRRYAWISLRLALVNILVITIFAVNFIFYAAVESPVAIIIRGMLLVFCLLWFAMQLYMAPFLIEQEDKRLRVALRNAAFLALATPLYTLTLLVSAGLIIVLSLTAILPLAVFTTSFLCLLGNRAVIDRLSIFGKLPSPPPATGETL
jgi:uncharacterized membrane protein YesL